MKLSSLGFVRSFTFSRVPVAALLLLPATLMVHGCASNRTLPTTNADTPRYAAGAAIPTGLVGTDAIEHSPNYRQAVLAFSGKDYRGALGRIELLLRTPDLSPDALAFLNRQRSLCQDAIAGHKLVRTPNAASVPQPVLSPKHSAFDSDCGPRALMLVCQELKTPANLDALRKAAGTTADGSSLAGIEKAAQSVGLTAEGVQMDQNALSNLSKPAISWVDGNHYIAVLSVHHSLMDPSVNGDKMTVHDPNHKGEEDMPLAGPTGLLLRSGGMLLLLSRNDKLTVASAH